MKIRIKFNRKMHLEKVQMIIMIFCISSFALLENITISMPALSVIKLPLLYIAGICILLNFNYVLKNIKKRKYFFIFVIICFFCIGLFGVAHVNKIPDIGTSPIRATYRLIIFLLEIVAMIIWVSETGREKFVLDFLYRYVLILVVVTDLMIFTNIFTLDTVNKDVYLVGTKFTVSYLHMELLTLWLMRSKRNFSKIPRIKLKVGIAAVVMLIIAFRIECMTAVIGCVVLVCMFAFLDSPIKKRVSLFCNPGMIAMVLILSIIFPLVVENMVSVPWVNYVIEELLGRDNTLTGRIDIFRVFAKKMDNHWLWGYGYGNGNMAAVMLFGYANAQNALFHWILQTGVVTTSMLAILIVQIFRQVYRSKKKEQVMPLIILIYVYTILGTIETTYGMSFILWLALITIFINVKGTEH